MKVIEETKLVKQVVILGKTVYRMRVTTSTFGNQLYLPQQWSNLRFIGPIYEFLRYILLRPTLVISKTKEISTYLGVAQILSHLYASILDEKNSGKYTLQNSSHGKLWGSAYRKSAFQPSAFRRLFIGFQPSAEKKLISMGKGLSPLGLRKIIAYQSEHFRLENFTSVFQKWGEILVF